MAAREIEEKNINYISSNTNVDLITVVVAAMR